MKKDLKQEWLDAAIAPEDRPLTLTERQVAEADEALVSAGGDAGLLARAGGEAEVALWYNADVRSRFAALGGNSRSAAKAKAARKNGKKGGRPRKS